MPYTPELKELIKVVEKTRQLLADKKGELRKIEAQLKG